MLKRRIIPVVLLKEGQIVQSKGFKRHQVIGDPIQSIERYSDWNADEIMYINISPDYSYSERHRDDIKMKGYSSFPELIGLIAEKNFCPLAVGGGIKQPQDVDNLFLSGADKITFCSAIIDSNHEILKYTIQKYGSQATVVVLDVFKNGLDYFIYDYRSRSQTAFPVLEAIRLCEEIGVGEIVVQDVQSDGRKLGMDIELFKMVSDSTRIPIIALGGIGSEYDFLDVFESTNVSAVAAANYFQHTELSFERVRRFLKSKVEYIR